MHPVHQADHTAQALARPIAELFSRNSVYVGSIFFGASPAPPVATMGPGKGSQRLEDSC